MGSLALPSSGHVYADTDTLIYSVETHPRYWPLLQPLGQAAKGGTFSIVSSELALMETMIGPLRSGDTMLLTAYEQVFQSSEMHLLPISQSILKEGARLRATIPAFRSPDALHAASATLAGCVQFLTNDVGFRRVPGLPVIILDEVLAAP
jgi:predicted nucleic acid-binding protein